LGLSLVLLLLLSFYLALYRSWSPAPQNELFAQVAGSFSGHASRLSWHESCCQVRGAELSRSGRARLRLRNEPRVAML
jgi:hypothetical protein